MLLDNYKILATIGEGGMGKVFKVMNKTSKAIYALKVAKVHSIQDSENFIKEASVWFKFRSVPQVAEIFEIIRIDSYNVGIVIEYIETGNLRDFMVRGEYSIDDVMLILYDISTAIYNCNRILTTFSHNDIKPENCLRTTHGLTKLTDFGIAKTSNEDIRTLVTNEDDINPNQSLVFERNKTKRFCGTPLYMSPEQILGTTITSESSDIYSFGIMALEILTGVHPLINKDFNGILSAHIQGLPPKLRKWPSKLPVKLKRALDSTIDANPKSRPSSMEIAEIIKSCFSNAMKIYSGVSIKLPDPVEDTLRKSRSLWTLSQHQLALDTLLESLDKDPYHTEGWIQASKWLFELKKKELKDNVLTIYKWLARGLILDQKKVSGDIDFYNTIRSYLSFNDEEKKEFINNQQKWLQNKENEIIKSRESNVRCLCVKCGAMKLNMIVRCSRCGFFPKSKKDIFNTLNLRVVKIQNKYATDYYSKIKILRILGRNVAAACQNLEKDPVYLNSLNSFFNTREGKETYLLANEGKINKKEIRHFKKFIRYLDNLE